jgi:hypothetical protein
MSSVPPLDPALASLLGPLKEIPPLLELVRARVVERARAATLTLPAIVAAPGDEGTGTLARRRVGAAQLVSLAPRPNQPAGPRLAGSPKTERR